MYKKNKNKKKKNYIYYINNKLFIKIPKGMFKFNLCYSSLLIFYLLPYKVILVLKFLK